LSQFRLLLQLYRRPLAAFSAIIDQGQVAFAIVAAISVMLLFQIPREMEIWRGIASAKAYVAAHKEEMRAVQEEWKRNPPPADADEEDDSPRLSNISWAVDVFTGYSYSSYLAGLAAIALCFVPAVGTWTRAPLRGPRTSLQQPRGHLAVPRLLCRSQHLCDSNDL
jgi:hypothetical protein